ncbi:MAG: hypothetical protein ABI969_09475 [bacterium]
MKTEEAQQVRWTADAKLAALHEELTALPVIRAPRRAQESVVPDGAGIFVPLQLAIDGALLSFISTTTVFGTSVDVTLSELALECFFAADAETAAWLRAREPEAIRAPTTSAQAVDRSVPFSRA